MGVSKNQMRECTGEGVDWLLVSKKQSRELKWNVVRIFNIVLRPSSPLFSSSSCLLRISFAKQSVYFHVIISCHHPSKSVFFLCFSFVRARWMILNDPLSRSLSRQNKNSQSESKNLRLLLRFFFFFLLLFILFLLTHFIFFSSYWLFYGLMATVLVKSRSLANHHVSKLDGN